MAVTNTTLTVGLLAVPIGLEKIADAKEPTFDRATKNGNAIARIERDSVTAEVISEDFPVVRGVFENPKDKTGFREIPAEKIEEIEAATKIEEFAIEAFVPVEDLPVERFTSCYFVRAQKGVNAKPLRVLYDAMKASGKAGVFKLALRTRQQPAVIYAKNGGLYVNTLVYAGDFGKAKQASEQLEAVEADPKMTAVAVNLIDQLSSTVEDSLDQLADDALPLREKLIQDALAGKEIKAPKKGAKPKVEAEEKDPLLAALERSVAMGAKPKKEKVPA
jgi:DNA end-binding protein Ku